MLLSFHFDWDLFVCFALHFIVFFEQFLCFVLFCVVPNSVFYRLQFVFRLTFLFIFFFFLKSAHREMRTITNYFLLNLSIADLMMSSLNCMFNFIYMLNSDWPFGRIYCSVNNFMGNVTVATSVFTLVAISFDR